MYRLQELPSVYKVRFFRALRYMNQARWLEYMGHYPNQFAGEGLLNLAKAIKIIFDCSGDVERLRKQLRLLHLRDDVLELIASVIYVRNQVDVGHIKLGLLQPKELFFFYNLVQKGTKVVSWLLSHVLDEIEYGRYELPVVPEGPSNAPALSRVAELLDKVSSSDSSQYLRANPLA